VSVIVLVGFAAMLWLVIREEVRKCLPARDMVTLLLGTLAGMASSVVAYWVGSFSGSMQKKCSDGEGAGAKVARTSVSRSRIGYGTTVSEAEGQCRHQRK
jgi:hypothetical protein